MTVITRFAPSPTGYLHIGSARTALFNYLFAKHNNGKFFLRIEDTDKERSNDESIKTILNGLSWLGLEWDGNYILQSQKEERHRQVALDLVEKGKAYYCFSSKEEIEEARTKSIEKGESFLFKSPWRDRNPSEYPKDEKPVVRLKIQDTSKIILDDLIQGKIEVESSIIDDMVLLRGDGTPTYMLAVVVDDHDMGITHIIRGDDHLNNAFRQIKIFEACGFPVPKMGHMPLIHSPEGTKLSKRHGAIGVDSYKDLGYLPEAIFNYLLKLGWSHGDDDIISREEAINWFNIENVGKSPSRIDFSKMKNLNGHYIRYSENEKLLNLVEEEIEKLGIILDQISKNNIEKAMNSLKIRAELITDLAKQALIFHNEDKFEVSEEAILVIKNSDQNLFQLTVEMLNSLSTPSSEILSESFKNLAKNLSLKLGDLMMPIRCAITGEKNSPSVFEIISIIGKEAAIRRINSAKKYQ